MSIRLLLLNESSYIYIHISISAVKIARGNTLLSMRNAATNTSTLEFVVFALRKFTGGMGDEDENQPEDETVWKRYFLKPFEVKYLF